MSSALEFAQDPGGVFGAKSSRKASEAQSKSAREANQELARQFDVTRADLRPRIEAGNLALQSQQGLLGLSGKDEQDKAFAALNESPGQKFIRGRAQKNLLRNSSAIGGLGGGNVRSELVQQGTGFAQQDLQQQFGRLGQIAGQGQASAVQAGQFGQNVASEKGANLRAAADARASGIMAQQQSKSNMLGTAATVVGAAFASDSNLKTNVKKVGTLESGAGWYIWEWKDFAKPYVGDQVGEGVMAQEYQHYNPDAVVMQNGYLAVNYGMVH